MIGMKISPAGQILCQLLAGNIFLETGKKGSKNGRRDHRIVSEENGRTKSEEDHRTGSAGPKNSGAGAPSWELRAESEDDYRDRVRKREEEEMKKSREDGTVLLTELGEAKGIGRLEPLDREAECVYGFHWYEVNQKRVRAFEKELADQNG